MSSNESSSQSHPYDRLTPDSIIDAVEALGYISDLRTIALNSYENRVYQIGIEEAQPLIAKFYRPARWSEQAIQEEHDFLIELAEQGLPVVAPTLIDQRSVFSHQGFYYSLFPRRGGHAPELSNEDDLELIGRVLAQLHNIGDAQLNGGKTFQHRPHIRGADDLRTARDQVLTSELMPNDYHQAYESLIDDILPLIEQHYQPQQLHYLRLHGDMHSGNLLLRDEDLYLVDFDDCLSGPAMQDIWMLLSGSDEEQRQQLMAISDGYEMFRPFPKAELSLIESLRTLRIARHAAWLCQRWSDPAFPLAFPWLDSHQFWSQHILQLREQFAALQQPPLTLPSFNC